MTQMSWFDITDGSRLMHEFIEKHGAHVIVPLDEDAGAAVVENRSNKEETENAGNAVVQAEIVPAATGVYGARGGKESRSSASSGMSSKKKLGPKLPPRGKKP
jgi:hypothetical protein